jgi:hypothetical protein
MKSRQVFLNETQRNGENTKPLTPDSKHSARPDT